MAYYDGRQPFGRIVLVHVFEETVQVAHMPDTARGPVIRIERMIERARHGTVQRATRLERAMNTVDTAQKTLRFVLQYSMSRLANAS